MTLVAPAAGCGSKLFLYCIKPAHLNGNSRPGIRTASRKTLIDLASVAGVIGKSELRRRVCDVFKNVGEQEQVAPPAVVCVR